MYQTYYQLQTLSNISDTIVPRNDLGYLVLSSGSNTSLSIPLVTKLYDYFKFAEIEKIAFTELFPNDINQPSLVDLENQITTLNAQLSGSNTQINDLNNIISGLLTPAAELELWRTHKTFKRIVEGKNVYTTGFPTINNWTLQQWGEYAQALIKVLGPNLTPEDQSLLAQLLTEIQTIEQLQNANPTDTALLDLAILINNADIPATDYHVNIITNGNVSIHGAIIDKLRDTNTIATVTKNEIDSLLTADIPTNYHFSTSSTQGTAYYAQISNFKTLCKKLVYKARQTVSNGNIPDADSVIKSVTTSIQIAQVAAIYSVDAWEGQTFLTVQSQLINGIIYYETIP